MGGGPIQTDSKHVTIERSHVKEPFGYSFGECVNNPRQHYVIDVLIGSAAATAGLTISDEIIEINNITITNLEHDAVNILVYNYTGLELHLKVKRFRSPEYRDEWKKMLCYTC